MTMETEITRIDTLTSPRIVVIDLDTGTVLGTNLVLAHVAETIEEEIVSSDSAAHEYGRLFGKPLLVDLADPA